MITELTKAQQKKIPIYLNKWLDIGYRTKTINRPKAKKAVNFLYEKILKQDKPKYVIFLDSPMACQLACNLLKDTKFDDKISDSQLRSQLRSQLYSQLDSQLYSQLDSQLDSQLRSQLYSQLRSQLRSQLYSQLYSQLDSQLRSQLYSQLDSQLRSQLYSQLRSQLYSQLRSQKLEYFPDTRSNWWNNWYWHYDFILNELFKEKKKEFKLFTEYLDGSQEYHCVYMFKDIVFLSDFPKAIRKNSEHQLHSYDKPALEYRDSYCLYRFNGITMKKEYVETPKDKITKEMFLSEENADQVRELIRKMGMDRVTEILNPKIVDTMETPTGGKYELLMINWDKRGDRPYLKMKCSSSEEVFILGVKPDIKTADEAWSFLNNGLKRNETEMVWEA